MKQIAAILFSILINNKIFVKTQSYDYYYPIIPMNDYIKPYRTLDCWECL